MGLFKGDDAMSDEDLNLEEQKAAIIRLSEEMADLATQLHDRALELQEEVQNAREQRP